MQRGSDEPDKEQVEEEDDDDDGVLVYGDIEGLVLGCQYASICAVGDYGSLDGCQYFKKECRYYYRFKDVEYKLYALWGEQSSG